MLGATRRTLAHPEHEAAHEAVALRRLARELGVSLNVEPAQDLVFEALRRDTGPGLRWLGETLGIAVDELGTPR